MYTSGNYLDKGPPVGGAVRVSARFTNKPSEIPSYCTPGTYNPDGCLYWSPDQIVFPFSGELNTIFITTRVSVYQSLPILTCDVLVSNRTTCVVPTISSLKSTKKVFYPAYVEKLTFQVDHKYQSL
jgi:hypothetical protein